MWFVWIGRSPNQSNASYVFDEKGKRRRVSMSVSALCSNFSAKNKLRKILRTQFSLSDVTLLFRVSNVVDNSGTFAIHWRNSSEPRHATWSCRVAMGIEPWGIVKFPGNRGLAVSWDPGISRGVPVGSKSEAKQTSNLSGQNQDLEAVRTEKLSKDGMGSDVKATF